MEKVIDGSLLCSADGKHLLCIQQRKRQRDLPMTALDGAKDRLLLTDLLGRGAATPGASGNRCWHVRRGEQPVP
jgi:hypothetical protein